MAGSGAKRRGTRKNEGQREKGTDSIPEYIKKKKQKSGKDVNVAERVWDGRRRGGEGRKGRWTSDIKERGSQSPVEMVCSPRNEDNSRERLV